MSDGIWTVSAEAVRWWPHTLEWNDAISEPCPWYAHGRWPLLPPDMAFYETHTNSTIGNLPDFREVRANRLHWDAVNEEYDLLRMEHGE